MKFQIKKNREQTQHRLILFLIFFFRRIMRSSMCHRSKLLIFCILNNQDIGFEINTSSSPCWGSNPEKSTLRQSTRAGVPVFNRSVSKPSRCKFSVSPRDADSPALPAGIEVLPTQIFPLINVPVVRTTEGAQKFMPKNVQTPSTLSFFPTKTSVTIASLMKRFGVLMQ